MRLTPASCLDGDGVLGTIGVLVLVLVLLLLLSLATGKGGECDRARSLLAPLLAVG